MAARHGHGVLSLSPERSGFAGGGDGCSCLRARPTVFLYLAAGTDEPVAFALVGFLVVEREIERENAVEVGAAEIQPRPDHADLVAHLEAAAAGKEVRIFLVARNLVGERVVDDDRFAAP